MRTATVHPQYDRTALQNQAFDLQHDFSDQHRGASFDKRRRRLKILLFGGLIILGILAIALGSSLGHNRSYAESTTDSTTKTTKTTAASTTTTVAHITDPTSIKNSAISRSTIPSDIASKSSISEFDVLEPDKFNGTFPTATAELTLANTLGAMSSTTTNASDWINSENMTTIPSDYTKSSIHDTESSATVGETNLTRETLSINKTITFSASSSTMSTKPDTAIDVASTAEQDITADSITPTPKQDIATDSTTPTPKQDIATNSTTPTPKQDIAVDSTSITKQNTATDSTSTSQQSIVADNTSTTTINHSLPSVLTITTYKPSTNIPSTPTKGVFTAGSSNAAMESTTSAQVTTAYTLSTRGSSVSTGNATE